MRQPECARLPRLAAAIVLAALMAGCGERPVLNRGDRAPPFALQSVAGATVRFPADPGVPTVVRFWADWCPYCYQEMRDLGPTAARLAPRGLVVVAVNAGQERAKVDAFVAKLGIAYPVLVDESGATARAFGVSALPTTFFVAADGRIHNKLVGEADAATFERLAQELLAAEPARGRP
jgi:peroxiredoxin